MNELKGFKYTGMLLENQEDTAHKKCFSMLVKASAN